ncbi:MAG: PAS domain S-box protein [Gammaproteobacteria bacterium]
MATGQPEAGLDSRRSAPLGGGRRLPSFSLLLMLLSLVLAGYFVDRANNAVALDHARSDVLQELSVLRARLEGQININLQSVQGLVAAIALEPDMDQARFADYARPLVTPATQLRNIAAAPDMIVRMTYPLEGNERVIGFDLTALPEQRSSAERAAQQSSMVVDGPISLVQGGVGIVGRIPIRYTDQDGQERFWGLISAVIDADRLYEVVGLTAASQHLQIAMRHVGANGQPGVPFYGAAGIFVANPVLVDITLPSGSWQMAALPVGGWPKRADNAWLLRLAMLGLGLLILLPSLVAFWQIRKSQEQTTRLRGLFELSPIGIALNDFSTGQFIDGNAALIRPSGYSLEEFGKLSYWDLTPQEYEAQEQHQLEQLRTQGRYGPYQKEYIRKDGSRYPVKLNGMLIHDASGRTLIWSIVEDISARKQAERQLAESRQQLALIIDGTGVGIWDWDIPSGATHFNERWAEIIGYRLDELEPVSISTWQAHAHPEDLVHSGRLLEAHWRRGNRPLQLPLPHTPQAGTLGVGAGYRPGGGMAAGRPPQADGEHHLDIRLVVATEQQLINARDAAKPLPRQGEFLATMSRLNPYPDEWCAGDAQPAPQRESLSEEQRRKILSPCPSADPALPAQ